MVKIRLAIRDGVLSLELMPPPPPAPDIERMEDLRLAAEDGRGPPRKARPDADAVEEDLRLAADGGRGRGRGPPRARQVEKLYDISWSESCVPTQESCPGHSCQW